MLRSRLAFSLLVLSLACGDDQAPPTDAGADAGDSLDAGPPAHCVDGVTNEDESDTDCGGSCEPCGIDRFCSAASDCESEVCGANGRCLQASCANGELDLLESDLDCGGPCDPCAVGQACGQRSDCESDLCQEERCRVDTCANGVMDASETDVDCGGECATCPAGASCGGPEDCAVGACAEGVCLDGCEATFGTTCAGVPITYFKGVNQPFSIFGRAVAIDGDVLAVSSPQLDRGETQDVGEVRIFHLVDGAWTLEAIVSSPVDQSTLFGESIALQGDRLVVAAPWHSGGGRGVDPVEGDPVFHSGAVYIFERDESGWSQVAFLKPPNTHDDQQFGSSVALDGDRVAVGARWDAASSTADPDALDAPQSGAVFTYTLDEGTWAAEAMVLPTILDEGDSFGTAVGLAGELLVVGAPDEDSTDTVIDGDASNNRGGGSGAVYAFRREGDAWVQEAYIKAFNANPGDALGEDLDFDGEWLVVAAPEEDGSGRVVDAENDNMAGEAGAAFVFHRDAAGVWTQDAYLKVSNGQDRDKFGNGIALFAGGVVVGAFLEDSDATGIEGPQSNSAALDSGAAYVFRRLADGSWRQSLYLKSPNTETGDYFGHYIAASGSRVLIGATDEDGSGTGVNPPFDDTGDTTGAAYLYDFGPR